MAPQNAQRQMVPRFLRIGRGQAVEKLRITEGAPGHLGHLLVGEGPEPDAPSGGLLKKLFGKT